jgi:hypothetical protein
MNKFVEKLNEATGVVQLWLMLILLIIPIVHITTYSKPSDEGPVYIHHHHKKILYITESDSFTPARLKAYLKEINIKFPEVVYNQARLESGNFKSNLFRKKHNMFGMKKAMSRATLSVGKPNEYAYFKSWKECVIDYALYQMKYFSKIKTEEKYIEKLCESYAENVHYKKLISELCGKD